MDVQSIAMTVNGREYEFSVGTRFGQVPPEETLVETLRRRLELTGAKQSCSEGACGCCTVILNGDAVPSCMMLTVDADGADILTIEGLEDPATGQLDPIQQAFIDAAAFQCGYCTPGIIMALKALLNKNPAPTEKEVDEALSGNYCRCVSHYHVFDAVRDLIGAGKEGE
ncbi:MAG: (2Fe-2S)-binding protein [Lachnospiraceae bacterium]|jgi:carbon-monoxide dehydrogenase small subunit|nr:(2Fe-2S)-binding protein [Lachnospiraceae bacterium]